MVIGVAALMQQVGLSMGLGSFLVGVILSESEYRHELESDLEPFKGLLLGLFFMTIGMMINTHILIERPFFVAGILFLYLGLKYLALIASGKLFKLNAASSRNMGFSVIQGSEFAFVIITILLQAKAMEQDLADLLIMVVSLSMAITPLLGTFNDRILSKTFQAPPLPFDEISDERPEVIVAGLGRFGQIISRLLTVRGIPFTALEHNPEQVEALRRFGNQVYYGDASRIDLLDKAGAPKAKYFVLAIGNVDASLYTAKVIREAYPHLKIFARARNRQHGFDLRDLGIEVFERDTFWSSVRLAKSLLVDWGENPESVSKILEIFVKHDMDMFDGQYKLRHNQDELLNFSKHSRDQLMEVMRGDKDIIKNLPVSHGAIEGPQVIPDSHSV